MFSSTTRIISIMEGDLLGLNFGQTTPVLNQAQQVPQYIIPGAVNQQQNSGQLQPDFAQLWPPAAQQPLHTATQPSSPIAQIQSPSTYFQQPTQQLQQPTQQQQQELTHQQQQLAHQQQQLAQQQQQLAQQQQRLAQQQQQSTQQPTQQQPTQQQQQPTQQQQQPTQQHPAVYNHPPTVAQQVQTPSTSTTGHNPTNGISPPVHNASNTEWKPAQLLDEPKNPVLREIKEKFAGRWKLVRSDPYDEYLKAAGVGIFARKLAITGAPEQIIEIRGNCILIDFHSTFHNQIYVFKLDESVENLVEKSRQSVFCSYKDGILTLLMTPLELGQNRTQEVQRFINAHGELVLMYTCGTATCRRYFARLADIVSPLNIVG